jgi:hypothetical protein
LINAGTLTPIEISTLLQLTVSLTN